MLCPLPLSSTESPAVAMERLPLKHNHAEHQGLVSNQQSPV